MRDKGKQGKAIESRIHNRTTQKKMPKNSQSRKARIARDHKEMLGKARENIEKPEKAIDRFARGARFARLPGVKQQKANESNEKQEQERKA